MRRIIAAAITQNDKILIAKRNYGLLEGFWEFPGGKVEENETDEECILREIQEEFSVKIKVGSYLGEHSFQVENKEYKIALYRAELISGKLQLTVHSDIAWVSVKELCDYKLAPVDNKLVQQCFGGN